MATNRRPQSTSTPSNISMNAGSRSFAGLGEAVLEAAVDSEDLLVEAIEVLGVAGLVDLLGQQEGLFALALVGHRAAPELCGHPLLADEERGQVPGQVAAQLAVHLLPSRGGPA